MSLPERIDSIRIQPVARTGGALYLAIILIGLFGELVVRGKVLVPGDAMATAFALRAMETLWRIGIAAEYVLLICALGLTLVFYLLLRPVSRHLAMLVVLLGLVSIAVEAVATLHLAEALHPISGAKYLEAYQATQLDAMTSIAIRSHSHAFGAALIFFGFECLVLGYLIFHSGFLPRLIGVLMVISGIGYLVNSFSQILVPEISSTVFKAVMLPILAGEGSLCLWLLFRGVDEAKWKARDLEPEVAQ